MRSLIFVLLIHLVGTFCRVIGASVLLLAFQIPFERGILFAQAEDKNNLKFIPLPVYATVPNEGATYGFMPVFLLTEPKTGSIKSIVAPSLTWNDVTQVTPTGRYFIYPRTEEEVNFQASFGTKVYKEAIAEWLNFERARGHWNWTLQMNYKEDPFRRFFGIGPHTARTDEGSYLLKSYRAQVRLGRNLREGFNVFGQTGFYTYAPRDRAIEGVDGAFQRHGRAPGLKPFPDAQTDSWTVQGLVGVKYDTRKEREYSKKGFFAEAAAGAAINRIYGDVGVYGISKLESKVLWEEFSWVSGAFRASINEVHGSGVPYYERPALGGSFLLRGFMLDRFVDEGAWTLDFEQRMTPVSLNIMGSQVDVRLDPFISVGQVYPHLSEVFDRVQWSQGIGIRAFVPPNVIGRIDIAHGGPDLNVYVELGYPF